MSAKYIFAIDPGNIESGWVLADASTLKPIAFGKEDNDTLLCTLFESSIREPGSIDYCIEKIMSYGMPVGAEVFDTCIWIGRFTECIVNLSIGEGYKKPKYINRLEEKLTICHSPKANDATIRQALIDRFAPGVSNYGKGNMKNPGWFYGFKKDIWQAYAVAVTYHDKYLEGEIHEGRINY